MDHSADYYLSDVHQDLRAHSYYHGASYPNPYDFQNGKPPSNGDFSMMRVINCDDTRDISDDKESYQSDIRAVANYLKTYWNSYAQSIAAEIQTVTKGDVIFNPLCLQDKIENGEVVCRDNTCVYELSL